MLLDKKSEWMKNDRVLVKVEIVYGKNGERSEMRERRKKEKEEREREMGEGRGERERERESERERETDRQTLFLVYNTILYCHTCTQKKKLKA